MRLDVYLHDDHVGKLERLEQGRLAFAYEMPVVEAGGVPLSSSLPLREGRFDDEHARPFFAGLLPEGEFLRRVARSFGVSASNPFSVLREIGGECAGAVSLTAEGHRPPSRREPRWLDSGQLAELIEELPRRPLLAGADEDGLRLSLAGAQEKLPVMFEGGRVGITRGAPPSTHIIKLPRPELRGMVVNEELCLRLARFAGLDAVHAKAHQAGPELPADQPEFLLVERYDRDAGARIHQEDLCQSLGVVPELKYEAEGGPGVAACSEHLREVSSVPAIDILAFADALLFNFIIGNHDAHAKNYSLLLEGARAPRLAPLYDLICTTAHEGTHKKLAMKLGGENRPDWVRARHLERAAGDLGMSWPALRDRAAKLCERVEEALPTALSEVPAGFGSDSEAIAARTSERIEAGAARLRRACRE